MPAATPILDLKEKPPKAAAKGSQTLRALVVGLVVGVLLGVAGIDWMPEWNLLLILPVLFVAIALHEAGHILAGRLAGMDLGGVAICGLIFMKSGRNWAFRFEPRLIGGGFAKPLPSRGTVELAPFAWTVAGGPIATLLVACLSGAAWLRYGPGAGGWIGLVCWVNAFLLLLSGLVSGGVNRSDGARLRLLLRHPAQAQAWMALLRVQAEEANGVLPRDWDTAEFERMIETPPAAPEYGYCHLLAYYRRLDERDEERALEHLETALAHSKAVGLLMRHCIFLEAASASAALRRNAQAARTWLDRAIRLRKPQLRASVENAIAMCEERYDDALRFQDEVRAFLVRRRLDSGLVRFARERLEEDERICRQTAVRLS
jgi:peptidase M50-like protein